MDQVDIHLEIKDGIVVDSTEDYQGQGKNNSIDLIIDIII